MNTPQQNVQYVDGSGRFTLAGMMFLAAMIDHINALEARIAALEP